MTLPENERKVRKALLRFFEYYFLKKLSPSDRLISLTFISEPNYLSFLISSASKKQIAICDHPFLKRLIATALNELDRLKDLKNAGRIIYPDAKDIIKTMLERIEAVEQEIRVKYITLDEEKALLKNTFLRRYPPGMIKLLKDPNTLRSFAADERDILLLKILMQMRAAAFEKYKIASSFFDDLSEMTVLDAGCGIYGPQFLKGKVKRYVGIDIVKEFASEDVLELDMLDIGNDDFKERFDTVFCINSLETCSDPKKAIRNLSQCLQNCGTMVLIRNKVEGAVLLAGPAPTLDSLIMYCLKARLLPLKGMLIQSYDSPTGLDYVLFLEKLPEERWESWNAQKLVPVFEQNENVYYFEWQWPRNQRDIREFI